MTITNIEAVSNTSFKPVLDNIENINETDVLLNNSVFTLANEAQNANETKTDTETRGFFDAVKDFFAGIFKSIGDFFKTLFSKDNINAQKEEHVKEEPPAADEEFEFDITGKEIIKELDINTKDGEIGYTKQSTKLGDCWALAGINALSYTEEGRKIIKDALEYKNGYTIVHLKGAGDYIIKDKEVEATQYMEDYSSGDWDMVILELAVKKVLKDIDGGDIDDVFHLITGKKTEHYSHHADDIINSGEDTGLNHYPGTTEEMMNKIEEDNGKNIAIGATYETVFYKAGTPIYIEDANGGYAPVITGHQYAVKSVRDGNVVITNPWDSSVEITLTKETFLDKFLHFQLCDLSAE